MVRTLALSMLSISMIVAHANAQDASHNGVFYATPAGWVSGMQGDQFVLAPADMTQENGVVVILGGAERLSGKTFDAWFRAKLASDLSPQVKVLQESPIQSGTVGALQTLSTGRTIQDTSGGVRLLVYHSISDGRQAAGALLVTASEAGMTKYSDGIRTLFQNLRFSAAAPAPAPGAAQPAAAAPAAGGLVPAAKSSGSSASGKGEPLPTAGIVGGKPQGLFAGVSLLSGNPVFLLFLPGGRVYHAIPRGGMTRIDWAAMEASNRDRCGRWSATGSSLRIQWNDGNVWDGPLELTQTGIKFQNKRYGRVVPVTAKEMTGSWEGSRSTAWLNLGSGPSTTQVNNITVDAAGNFAFTSATGSSVAGASAYGESRLRGRLTVEGYDAVFRQADGATLRMSLSRFPDGKDLILLDGTVFTRR